MCILAVAAAEAYLNEVFLDPLTERELARQAGVPDVDAGKLANLDLCTKMLLLPHLCLGWSLEADKQPYQDFRVLVSLRNRLVHYKIQDAPPRFAGYLQRRQVFLPETTPWTKAASSTETMRWALNAVARSVRAIADRANQIGEGPFFRCAPALGYNFFEFSEDEVKKWLAGDVPREKRYLSEVTW